VGSVPWGALRFWIQSLASGEAGMRKVLSTGTVDCRMSDELLFAMLFVVAIAALLPSVWW
jgi:hypothetical protein